MKNLENETTLELVGFETHYNVHEISQEWNSDFYSYFDEPENACRYKPSMSFLKEKFGGRHFTLLDLGCGSGILIKYLPEGCDYLGVDHNEQALNHCEANYPNHRFICQDILEFLQKSAEKKEKFDSIVLCGLLFNSVNKETRKKSNDLEILQLCLNPLLSTQGYVILIVPFVYSDSEQFSLMRQAEWKLNSIDRLLKEVEHKKVFQCMSLQIGLEEKIKRQKVLPDWFSPDGTGPLSHLFGTYMGSWTLILTTPHP